MVSSHAFRPHPEKCFFLLLYIAFPHKILFEESLSAVKEKCSFKAVSLNDLEAMKFSYKVYGFLVSK